MSAWTDYSGNHMEPRTPHTEEDTGWRIRAACLGVDPDLFFPTGSGKGFDEQTEAAKAFCGMCAVQAECLESALERNEQYGVWGGTTYEERRVIIRRHRAS